MRAPRLTLLLIGIALSSIRADVTLAPLFQDNAVLQQGKPVPVWGGATPGEKVTVTFGSQKKETTTGQDGRWRVNLDPLPASTTPAELQVNGANELRVKNILVGEVWICSGQSNMEFRVENVNDAEKEIATANHPLIRLFRAEHTTSGRPAQTVPGAWTVCSPETVKDYTAAGYFFARNISEKLGVPVGLVHTSWGGTPIEAWLSNAALKSHPAFQTVFDRWEKYKATYPAKLKQYEADLAEWQKLASAAKAQGQPEPKAPTKPEGQSKRAVPSGLFNGMVNPLLPYAARGILWYQGEANARRFPEYSALFAALITHWRKEFSDETLPFYFVQLANFNRKGDASKVQWAYQREAQASALKLPNTGMAVAIDIGDPGDIHPKNKQEVGRRLALIALALTYEKGGEYAGPIFQFAQPDGAAMKATFSHADGLKLLENAGGFEVAGNDQVFHVATARVEGSNVLASSPAVKSPVAIRYAWQNNPTVSLYNVAGLPAAPFRSDSWPAPANALIIED